MPCRTQHCGAYDNRLVGQSRKLPVWGHPAVRIVGEPLHGGSAPGLPRAGHYGSTGARRVRRAAAHSTLMPTASARSSTM